MKNKIRVYVETLFDGALKTEEVVEMREEILQNVIDKYDDLVADGKSEDEAYSIAVSGIGDVGALLRSMNGNEQEESYNPYGKEENAPVYTEQKQEAKGKTAYLIIAVVLYILSIVPLIAADELVGTDKAEGIGACLLFVICAIATGFIIAYAASKPKTSSADIANESKLKSEKYENPVVKSINGAIWTVGTVIYFIVSFSTGAWFITWLIFCITDSVTEVVKAIFMLKEQEGKYE